MSRNGEVLPKEEKRRVVFLWFAVFGGVLVAAVFASTLDRIYAAPSNMAAYISVMFTALCAGFLVLTGRELKNSLLVFLLYLNCIAIYTWDMNSRALAISGGWPALVLVIDILLVMRVPSLCTTFVVVTTVIYLGVMALEETFRFGLLDLPGLTPQDGEYGRKEHFRLMIECETLPCRVPFPPRGMAIPIGVFVLDFLVTRGFAEDAMKQQESMERTIDTVQEIASLLARYDVKHVAELLEAHQKDLPEGMTAALRRLEGNLRVYKAYLPSALFEADDEASEQVFVAPPGRETEVATIAFTDIRASTSIWESAPDGMRAGLRIHNAVMREVMQRFTGYEVKTIGDAFMVAFSCTQDGVNFGLNVHEQLRNADWPADLLTDSPICAPQGPLWGGLTVRIGVNTGPVSIEQSALTGRTDYFGHTVNVASRLESTCQPGAVAVPSELWESDCGGCEAIVGTSQALDLKGVSGKTFVCCLWPHSLAGRRTAPLKEVADSTAWVQTATVASFAHTEPNHDNKSLGVTKFTSTAWSLPPSVFNGTISDKQHNATIGVVELTVNDQTGALQTMSQALSALNVPMDQSGASLVTVLSDRVCVGWNLTRSAPAHMEQAIRFAQRIQSAESVSGGAFVSGAVQHGDVGSRRQRFVTVMGKVVKRSWALCEEAVAEKGCYFEPPWGTVLPLSFESVLLTDELRAGVYKVQAGRACCSVPAVVQCSVATEQLHTPNERPVPWSPSMPSGISGEGCSMSQGGGGGGVGSSALYAPDATTGSCSAKTLHLGE